MSIRPCVRVLTAVLLLAWLCAAGGCVTHEHRIGLGPTGAGAEHGRQYYLFFGLMQLNDVDVQRMASDLNSYSVETRFGWTDLILSPFLLPLSITTRSVTVRR